MKTFSFVLVSALILFSSGAFAEQGQSPLPYNVGGIENADGGTISGIVLFRGEKPAPQPIKEIAGNAFCKHCYSGDLPKNDSVVLGHNGSNDTVANVLVYVSKGLEGKQFKAPAHSVLLDQVGCMYQPHVVAVMVGQTLEIRNSDATLHNVMCTPSHNTPFNFGMPSKDQVMERVFRQPEFKMNFRCFMHPWMSAYVHVLPNPFFAVTQSDGTFKITGLPAGDYVITVLHESSILEAESQDISVKLEPRQTKQISFTYKPKTIAK